MTGSEELETVVRIILIIISILLGYSLGKHRKRKEEEETGK